MPSLVSSKYDANKAYPLSKNYAKNPNPDPFRLCYHRFLDSTGTEHEIFVPPGKEREIIELDENKDWDALMNFPAFSDRPPVSSMQPNCVSVPMGAGGSMVSFYIPEDEGKNDRVCELVSVEDYQTLEREFEPWNNQPHSSVQKRAEWQRGIQRCALAREEEARKKRQAK